MSSSDTLKMPSSNVGFRDALDGVAELDGDQLRKVGIDELSPGLSIWPSFIRNLMTSTERSDMRCESSWM